MKNKDANIIQIASISSLNLWGTRGSIVNSRKMKHGQYPQVMLADVMKRSKDVVNLSPNCVYKRITIKSGFGGVVLRDIESGARIKTRRQFRVSMGQLLISKIDARNGAVGVVPKELDGAIITGNFWTFDVDRSLASADYLSLVCASTKFIDFSEKNSAGSTNRHYLQEADFLSQYIPLPPLSEQIVLVNSYNAMIGQAELKEVALQGSRKEMEKWVMDTLYIGSQLRQEIVPEESKSLFHICLISEMHVWSPKNYLKKSGFESSFYSNVKLSDMVYINPRTSFFSLLDDDKISFVPMNAISDVYGTYEEHQFKPKSESKNYTHFMNGDLLWAKITPCMENGKSAVVTNLKKSFGFGSTEFYVLRSKDDSVDIRYIAVLLRLSKLLQDAKLSFTGSAGQQRVPVQYLKDLVLPFPPMKIQQLIINKRNEWETNQRKLVGEIKLLKEEAKEQFETKIYS